MTAGINILPNSFAVMATGIDIRPNSDCCKSNRDPDQHFLISKQQNIIRPFINVATATGIIIWLGFCCSTTNREAKLDQLLSLEQHSRNTYCIISAIIASIAIAIFIQHSFYCWKSSMDNYMTLHKFLQKQPFLLQQQQEYLKGTAFAISTAT